MKIKLRDLDYAQVLALPRPQHQRPQRQRRLFRLLLHMLAHTDPAARQAQFVESGMAELRRQGGPWLVLMNHSCFLDLKLASRYLRDRPFSIVCTSDGFVGKYGLMRALGCIPTPKFVTSPTLVRDMDFALHQLGQSVLMYPEASYSFDGKATPLPQALGRLLKLLKVPVVTMITQGAFSHDPLYNGLQERQVPVSVEVKYLLSPESISQSTPEQLNQVLAREFSFDNFAWQRDNRIRIDAPFRADGLNRVLYKCPHCRQEGQMLGHGVNLSCQACGRVWLLDEYGRLRLQTPSGGETEFSHIPDWYAWERDQVRQEILAGVYSLDLEVDIRMMADYRAIYNVGQGRLRHDSSGFHLQGCQGRLDYRQPPAASYSLYADYLWYELGDMVCIGNGRLLYYCFPRRGGDIVAKARLATEEMYKLAGGG